MKNRTVVNRFSGTRTVVTADPTDRHGRSRVIRQYLSRKVSRRMARSRADAATHAHLLRLGRENVARREEARRDHED